MDLARELSIALQLNKMLIGPRQGKGDRFWPMLASARFFFRL